MNFKDAFGGKFFECPICVISTKQLERFSLCILLFFIFHNMNRKQKDFQNALSSNENANLVKKI